MPPSTSAPWQLLTPANSGLPVAWVTGIAEDPAGNLWFSTYGGGLARCRADLSDWAVWRAGSTALPNDWVGLVAPDSAGNVWAVCDALSLDDPAQAGALCLLTAGGDFQVFPRAPGDPCVLSMEADRHGLLWLCTGGLVVSGGPTRCDGLRTGTGHPEAGQWMTFDGTACSALPSLRAAAEAWWPRRPEAGAGRRAGGRLGWEAAGGLLWLLETERHEFPAAPISPFGIGGSPLAGLPPGGFMPSMALIPGMGSFLAEYRLLRFDGATWSSTNLPSPFRYGELVVDTRGHAWVSLVMLGDIVLGRGVARFSGETWTAFDRSSGMTRDTAVSLTADSAGNVWCAHMLGDLSRWDGQGWTFLPGGEEGRPKEDLGRATEDRRGRLWFPSKAGALLYTS